MLLTIGKTTFSFGVASKQHWAERYFTETREWVTTHKYFAIEKKDYGNGVVIFWIFIWCFFFGIGLKGI